MFPGAPAVRAAKPIMSDERKPRRDSGGHITIPPELRAFGGKEGPGPARVREKSPGAEAMFTKIAGELGEEGSDVQVIDPDRGVGNASAYVGPLTVPEAVVGKGVTSKVKIDAGKVKSDPPPAMSVEGEGEGEGEGDSPWAKMPLPALDPGDLPSALLARPVEGGGVVESKRPEPKERRYGVLALAIGGAVLLGLAVVTVIKLGEVPEKPMGVVPAAVMSSGALPATATATATARRRQRQRGERRGRGSRRRAGRLRRGRWCRRCPARRCPR